MNNFRFDATGNDMSYGLQRKVFLLFFVIAVNLLDDVLCIEERVIYLKKCQGSSSVN